MARIKNVSGVDREVAGRLVLAGAVIDVPDDAVWSYTCQPATWAPADDATAALHRAAKELYAPDPVEVVPTEVVRPAGNAAREEWVAYAVASGHAPNPESLDGVGRDEIRDSIPTED